MSQDHTRQPSENRCGVYGVELEGVPAGDEWAFVPVSQDAENWTIETIVGGKDPAPRGEHADDDTAVVGLPDGAWSHHDRASRTARFHLPHAVPGELFAHPLLGGTGVIAAHWRGDLPLHAGAVLLGDAAWAILGDRERGKSTQLAALHRAGVPVIADDILVVDEHLVAHAGPRTLDLRRDMAPHFPGAAELHGAGARERFRLRLPSVPSTVPLGGLLALEWGDELSITRVPVLQRLPLIAGALAIRKPTSSPQGLMALAELPFFRVTRPKRLEGLDATTEAILSLADRPA